MTRLLFLALGAGAASAAAIGAPVPTSDAPTISRNGLGDVHVGMTYTQAVKAAGVAFTKPEGDPTCRVATPKDARLGYSLMLARQDRVTRLTFFKPMFSTTAGIHVGSTQKEVLKAYPTAVSVPHKYDPKGKEIWVGAAPTARAGRALVFETDGTRVTIIRAGKLPQVGYVEGCA